MAYNTAYKTQRVQNIQDAIDIEPKEPVDVMLWTLDVYDLTLGKPPNKILHDRVQQIFMKWYHKLCVPLPFMRNWTFSMLLFVCLLSTMQRSQDKDINTTKEKIERDALLFYTQNWDIYTPDFSAAATWILQIHTCPQFSKKVNEFYKTNDDFIGYTMGRYYWMHQFLNQWTWFPKKKYDIPTTNVNKWIKKETRHLKITKFRRDTSKFIMEHILYPGDREAANLGTLAEPISGYSVLMGTAPGIFLRNLQNSIMYDSYAELRQSPYKNLIHFALVNAHFEKIHKIPFGKYFMCWEERLHAHQNYLKRNHMPVIVQMKRQYFCLYNGVMHHGNKSFIDAFVIWVLLFEGTEFKKTDLSQTFQNILTPQKTITTNKLFYEL